MNVTTQTPSSCGMVFCGTTWFKKYLSKKKYFFISVFKPGFISFVMTCFSLSHNDTAQIVCTMIRVTTAMDFRNDQPSQTFGAIIQSFSLISITFLLYITGLQVHKTRLVTILCNTLSPLFLLARIMQLQASDGAVFSTP